MTRHELRYKAMTILYQADLYDNNNIKYDIKDIIKEQMQEENKFVTDLVMGVLKEKNNIDKLANKYLKNWDITRLGYTDQAIIRIGIYELLHTNTPDIACIDEAIELSHAYSDEKVSKMINGILDKIYHYEIKKDK